MVAQLKLSTCKRKKNNESRIWQRLSMSTNALSRSNHLCQCSHTSGFIYILALTYASYFEQPSYIIAVVFSISLYFVSKLTEKKEKKLLNIDIYAFIWFLSGKFDLSGQSYLNSNIILLCFFFQNHKFYLTEHLFIGFYFDI